MWLTERDVVIISFVSNTYFPPKYDGIKIASLFPEPNTRRPHLCSSSSDPDFLILYIRSLLCEFPQGERFRAQRRHRSQGSSQAGPKSRATHRRGLVGFFFAKSLEYLMVIYFFYYYYFSSSYYRSPF